MRLGSYECKLASGSLASSVYEAKTISERHRHRYEVNNHYREILEKAGLVFSGVNPEMNLVEMMELPGHPWFLTCQFHPEFKSKPFSPHPLFVHFVKASLIEGARRGKEVNARVMKTPVKSDGSKKHKASSVPSPVRAKSRAMRDDIAQK